MKFFENDIYNYFSQDDIDGIVRDINEIYPLTKTDNFFTANLDESLSYINTIPTLLFGFTNPMGPILLNVIDSKKLPDNKDGSDLNVWHSDCEEEDQITVLFYPQIDLNCGGEFSTYKKTQSISPGNMIIIPSNEVHMVNHYTGSKARICLKWMFKVDIDCADEFRD